ncbi:MAG: GNAT family N-acetyltransferase [Peptostreptococcaceae bacterium]
MIIREIKINDYNEVDKLMQQVHGIHVLNRPDLYIDMEHPYSISELEKIIEDDKVISVLAESDGDILGLCIVSIRNKSGMVEKQIAYMDDLCVDENARGRGIGKELFSFVSNEAKKRGAERLDLTVWSFNNKALSFYEELGMQTQRYILEKELK